MDKKKFIRPELYKTILITATKGGCGKSLITFCLAAYLASIHKKVKIINFDKLNSGIFVLNEKYYPKDKSPLVIQDFEPHEYCKNIKEYKQMIEGYDYILQDGYYSPTLTRLYSMTSYIPRVYFIIASDLTFQLSACTSVLSEYINIFDNKLKIVFNNKIDDIYTLGKVKMFIERYLLDYSKQHKKDVSEIFIRQAIPFIYWKNFDLPIIEFLGKEVWECHQPY